VVKSSMVLLALREGCNYCQAHKRFLWSYRSVTSTYVSKCGAKARSGSASAVAPG
jgi:hypothetical protein